MPELPEVETIARQLDRAISGKEISEIEVLRSNSFQGNKEDLIGKKIEKIDRHGKVLVWHFKSFGDVIQIHLKMTGQLIYDSKAHRIVGGHPTADWINKLPSKHTRVIISFRDGSVLYFNDMRVFGWIKVTPKIEFEKWLKQLPPDVNSKEFTKDYFSEVVGRAGRPIKLVVMDSAKVGGAGNIYANDALWLAKIDPRKRAKELTDSEIKNLFNSLKEVIEKGIKYGGASASNYVHISGLGGTYQDHFLVYKRDGEKCPRDGEKIQKIKLGGRGTYFCPKCQA